MRPCTIEVAFSILAQNATQLSLAEYEQVVKALPAHGAEEAFTDGVEIGRARRDAHDLDACPFGRGIGSSSKLVIVVADEVIRPVTVRRGHPELLGGPDVSGAGGHIAVNDFPRAVDQEEEGVLPAAVRARVDGGL